MVFNLVPIPPLDGSRILALFVPQLENPKFELYGFLILMVILFFFNGFVFLRPIVNFILLQVFKIPFGV